MEAALAEMALDATNKDLDDDKEFVNDKGCPPYISFSIFPDIVVTDEQDVFESDFASTDEEADHEGEDAGEQAVYDEERSARRV
jgi:vacuolar protein sorting-associated protein 72